MDDCEMESCLKPAKLSEAESRMITDMLSYPYSSQAMRGYLLKLMDLYLDEVIVPASVLNVFYQLYSSFIYHRDMFSDDVTKIFSTHK